MKHCSEKDLLKFCREKTSSVERHLKECSSCLMKYNFLSMKMGLKSYIEYDKGRVKDESGDCLSPVELDRYASGNAAGDEKKRIKDHLTWCEGCVQNYFNLRPVNQNSLWLSIEEALSVSMDWIKGIYLVPDLAVSRETRRKSDIMQAFIGDEVRLEIPVNKDGYLTILHWNGEKISLLFPHPDEQDNSVKAESVKILRGRIEPPEGIQQIKLFLTGDRLINTEEIDFNDINSVMKNIEDFMKKLDELDDNKWSEKSVKFKVMRFKG